MSRAFASVEYERSIRARTGVLYALFACVLASFLLDIAKGPGHFTILEVAEALLARPSVDRRLLIIVWEVRLPIAILAVLVGAMLGISGAGMQTILGNPLAEPYTLGISAAASVGASIAITYGWTIIPGGGTIATAANAFACSIAASIILLSITRQRGASPEAMVLVGVALLFTSNALLAAIQYHANEAQLQHIVFWMMGSLGRATYEKSAIAALVLFVSAPWMFRRAWELTALRMGDERAETLGVSVSPLRLEILALVSLMSAVSVSFVGAIGFVGLVGPHIARMLVGEDHRFYLPCAALLGALLLSTASVVSKMVTPGIVYPVGVITALVGLPFFAFLVLSVRKSSHYGA